MKMWPVCNKMCTVLLLCYILSPMLKHIFLWKYLTSLWKQDTCRVIKTKYITIWVMLFSVPARLWFLRLLLPLPSFFQVLLLLKGTVIPIPMGIKKFAMLLIARLALNFVALRTWGSSGSSGKAQDTSGLAIRCHAGHAAHLCLETTRWLSK